MLVLTHTHCASVLCVPVSPWQDKLVEAAVMTPAVCTPATCFACAHAHPMHCDPFPCRISWWKQLFHALHGDDYSILYSLLALLALVPVLALMHSQCANVLWYWCVCCRISWWKQQYTCTGPTGCPFSGPHYPIGQEES